MNLSTTLTRGSPRRDSRNATPRLVGAAMTHGVFELCVRARVSGVYAPSGGRSSLARTKSVGPKDAFAASGPLPTIHGSMPTLESVRTTRLRQRRSDVATTAEPDERAGWVAGDSRARG